MLEKEKEARKQTRFDILQQHFEQFGIPLPIDSFLPKECKHRIELPNGATIRTETYKNPQIAVELAEEDKFEFLPDGNPNEVVFEIRERFCWQCGKTLQIEQKRLFLTESELVQLRRTLTFGQFGKQTQNKTEFENGGEK
jgi:hypothetical protein